MNDEMKQECIKKAIRLGLTLFTVTAVTGLILGLVEYGTRDAIMNARNAERSAALREVIPDADTFSPVDVAGINDTADAFVTGAEAAMKGSDIIGHCLYVTTKGFGGPVSMVVGVTADGAVKAMRVLAHGETPGLGARAAEPDFFGQFADRAKTPLSVTKGEPGEAEIAAISGATITSTAVVNGVNTAVKYWGENLSGKPKTDAASGATKAAAPKTEAVSGATKAGKTKTEAVSSATKADKPKHDAASGATKAAAAHKKSEPAEQKKSDAVSSATKSDNAKGGQK